MFQTILQPCSVFFMFSALLLFSSTALTQAYIVSSPTHQLPWVKTLDYLQERTQGIVSSPPGNLSDHQLDASHDLLHAWSTMASSSPSTRSETAAKHTEHVVKRLLEERNAGNTHAVVHTGDYNCVLTSWAHCGTIASAQRAAAILKGLLDHNIQSDHASYQACFMAWANVVLLSPSSSRNNNKSNNNNTSQDDLLMAAQNAQRVLQEMPSAAITAGCYATLLQVWSRLGQAQQAEDVLGDMVANASESNSITVDSFNAVLLAWWRSQDYENAALRMGQIVAFMELNSDYTPDASTYRTVMNTFLHLPDKTQALSRSLALLEHIVAKNKDATKLLTHVILWNGPMGLLAKQATSTNRYYRKAHAILQHMRTMKSKRVQPDVFSITSVLGACANSLRGNNRQVLATAMSTYELFDELNIEPNHISLATMLKVCSHINEKSVKQTWVQRVYQDAINYGYEKDPFVLKRLQQCQRHNSNRKQQQRKPKQQFKRQQRRAEV